MYVGHCHTARPAALQAFVFRHWAAGRRQAAADVAGVRASTHLEKEAVPPYARQRQVAALPQARERQQQGGRQRSLLAPRLLPAVLRPVSTQLPIISCTISCAFKGSLGGA